MASDITGNRALGAYGITIFTTMSALAIEHNAINLGQGFPDEEGPLDIRQAAADALLNGSNQYPPAPGIPALRQAVADHDKRFYGYDYVTPDHVLVCSGATEALTAALMGLLNPGDEVVLFEPLYDSYLPIIEQIGAVPRLVKLCPPDWAVPTAALEAAFSDKTKLVVLNSPMNPTGKLFTDEELEAIAALCVRHQVPALCDEVYEHLVFDGQHHTPLMSFEGMADLAIRVGSAGKTFSLTGWKVGYITAAPYLIDMIGKAHQFLTFTTPPDLQTAVAYGLGKPDGYFKELTSDLQGKRDRLADGLREVGFIVHPAAGTYFLTADYAPLMERLGIDEPAAAFCERMTRDAGVAAVPVSAFYAPERVSGTPLPDEVRTVVRFCFSKRHEVLDEAVKRLAAYVERG